MSAKWIVALWGVICLAGLLTLSVSQLDEFDPQSKLAIALTDVAFEQKFISQLQQQHKWLGQSLVHFSDTNCFCETIAQPHIARLSQNMLDNGFQNIHINISIHPEFARFVPSTPAVAIIGALQELIYFGPYAEGYGCLSGTGLVDAILPKLNSPTIENSILITDAKGCYCHT
ncbi:MAG: DUF6436 domain-containing protein [Paraglaciecola sp.]|uniref:DUF6436 domain-containing protein n=1 Tax=Paraglaciecola sp. TaxID=1920173 RepID=UPI0032972BFE